MGYKKTYSLSTLCMMGLITGCNFHKNLVEGLNVNLRATQSYILIIRT